MRKCGDRNGRCGNYSAFLILTALSVAEFIDNGTPYYNL